LVLIAGQVHPKREEEIVLERVVRSEERALSSIDPKFSPPSAASS
jgi:hypothetical protein